MDGAMEADHEALRFPLPGLDLQAATLQEKLRRPSRSSSPVPAAASSAASCPSGKRPSCRRLRPMAMSTPTPSLGYPEDTEDCSATHSPPGLSKNNRIPVRPRCLSLLSGSSLGTLKAQDTDPASPGFGPSLSPETPVPKRAAFRQVECGFTVVMFDFDGTLTATPGDRAARSQKKAELRQRAAMLEPCLKAMQESGATLGIISKSTEGTIRDALQAAGLAAYFQGPVVGKAVSFEGKAGIIDDLARSGALAGFQSAGLVEQAASQCVLLVDDDVMELERARSAGIQTYAAPSKGGLQHEDFEVILAAMHGSPPVQQQQQQQQQQQTALRAAVGSAPSPGRFGAHRGSPSWPVAASPSLAVTRRGYSVSDLSCGRTSGKWRNLILFSGECFEG